MPKSSSTVNSAIHVLVLSVAFILHSSTPVLHCNTLNTPVPKVFCSCEVLHSINCRKETMVLKVRTGNLAHAFELSCLLCIVLTSMSCRGEQSPTGAVGQLSASAFDQHTAARSYCVGHVQSAPQLLLVTVNVTRTSTITNSPSPLHHTHTPAHSPNYPVAPLLCTHFVTLMDAKLCGAKDCTE